MCIITLDLNILMRLDDMLVQNRPLISIISYNRCKRFQEKGEGMYTFIISIILLVMDISLMENTLKNVRS